MDKKETMNYLNCSVDDNLNFSQVTTTTNSTDTITVGNTLSGTTSCWHYWERDYYPIIRESYPVYIQERARDKGKEAFEIIKMLKDKRFLKIETVGDFIDAMDALIKIL